MGATVLWGPRTGREGIPTGEWGRRDESAGDGCGPPLWFRAAPGIPRKPKKMRGDPRAPPGRSHFPDIAPTTIPYIRCPIRLPPAIIIEPEKSGIPIMGITATWAMSHGSIAKRAPRIVAGPGRRDARNLP